MDKSIIIIGAGIAGLSAGCYARMNGYRAVIFELHDKPGGLCTSWKRQGYVIDGCLHWLVGSAPGTNLYNIWLELGALQGRKIVDHEELMRFQGPDGKTLILYSNVDKLEAHLLGLSPGDARPIKDFTAAIRKFTRFDPPLGKPREIAGVLDRFLGLAKMAPYLPAFLKWTKISIQDFSQRFKDPFLAQAFLKTFDLPDFPMAAMIITMAWLHNRCSGYPIGGSLEFSRGIERRFLDLGGEIRYRARVVKVLVEQGRAVGVRLEDGTEHRADAVISAADGHSTIFKMLDGKYVDQEIQRDYDSMPRFKSLVQVSVGVDQDLSSEPAMTIYPLDQPVTIGGEKQTEFSIHNYAMDPTMAPPGKTVLACRFLSDIKFWRELAADRDRYETEKEKLSDLVIGLIESKYPGISEKVEMVDVATPLTFERYTANWEGSMEGWLITTSSLLKRMKRTLPGLDNFYMIGQWVQPGGGVPTGAMTAREIIEVICHHDRRSFTTSLPAADPGK